MNEQLESLERIIERGLLYNQTKLALHSAAMIVIHRDTVQHNMDMWFHTLKEVRDLMANIYG